MKLTIALLTVGLALAGYYMYQAGLHVGRNDWVVDIWFAFIAALISFAYVAVVIREMLHKERRQVHWARYDAQKEANKEVQRFKDEVVRKYAETEKAMRSEIEEIQAELDEMVHEEYLTTTLDKIIDETTGGKRPLRTDEIPHVQKIFTSRTAHYVQMELVMGGMNFEVSPLPFEATVTQITTTGTTMDTVVNNKKSKKG